MKKSRFLFFISIILLFVSCGGKSSSDSEENSYGLEYELKNNSSSNNYSYEATSQPREQTTYYQENENIATGNEISKVLNTKWTFTDSYGTVFTLKVNDIARDGKSAKAELIVNGKTDYATVSARYHLSDSKKIFYYYDFDESSHTSIFLPSSKGTYDYSFLGIMAWDYDNGYLYKDESSFDSESPVDRLSIKQIK